MEEFTELEVREELGNPDEDLISLDKLTSIIEEEKSFYGSVARAARVIANAFALEADKRMGPLSISYQERAERWLKLADRYEEKMVLEAGPYAGGISKSDKEANRLDSDRPTNAFRRGMFEIGDDDNESF